MDSLETGEKIKLYNVTLNGEIIKGFRNIKTTDLKNLI